MRRADLGIARIAEARVERGRSGLIVPEQELRKIGLVRIAKRRDEILDRHRLAIVALEIEIEPAPEAVLAQHGLHHPAKLGALVVNGARVEVVDLDERGGPHGMGERAGILRELRALEKPHFLDALHDRASANRR